MSKKNFTGGLNSLLGDQPDKPKKTRSKTPPREITKSSQKDLPENETRATFIVREDTLEKLKDIAYWDRRLIKDVIKDILEDGVARYEKENGELKPRPKK